jgi:hypothetical protein
MDYTRLSLQEVRSAIDDIARDAETCFGALTPTQLNWRPDASRWSVAQCFEHLLTSNRLAKQAADDALRNRTHTIWQRVPIVPRLIGPALIRSQTPDTTRKFKAPAKVRPATSDVPGDVIQRFVEQHREVGAWTTSFGETDAAHAIMVSPFLRVVSYSVLDACRLLVAHDRRHFEQARRVTSSPGFPSAH